MPSLCDLPDLLCVKHAVLMPGLCDLLDPACVWPGNGSIPE